MTDPIEELAMLDIDALWQKVCADQPPEAPAFDELVRRLHGQYDAMQEAEEAKLASGKRKPRKGEKQPK